MKKGFNYMLAGLLLISAVSLTACSSGQEDADGASEETEETEEVTSALYELNNDTWKEYFEEEIVCVPEYEFDDSGIKTGTSSYYLRLKDEYQSRLDQFNFDASVTATVTSHKYLRYVSEENGELVIGEIYEDKGEETEECDGMYFVTLDDGKIYLFLTYYNLQGYENREDGTTASFMGFADDMTLDSIEGSIALFD